MPRHLRATWAEAGHCRSDRQAESCASCAWVGLHCSRQQAGTNWNPQARPWLLDCQQSDRSPGKQGRVLTSARNSVRSCCCSQGSRPAWQRRRRSCRRWPAGATGCRAGAGAQKPGRHPARVTAHRPGAARWHLLPASPTRSCSLCPACHSRSCPCRDAAMISRGRGVSQLRDTGRSGRGRPAPSGRAALQPGGKHPGLPSRRALTSNQVARPSIHSPWPGSPAGSEAGPPWWRRRAAAAGLGSSPRHSRRPTASAKDLAEDTMAPRTWVRGQVDWHQE